MSIHKYIQFLEKNNNKDNAVILSSLYQLNERCMQPQHTSQYAGTVKRQNVCKRHVAIGTGFKQTERTKVTGLPAQSSNSCSAWFVWNQPHMYKDC